MRKAITIGVTIITTVLSISALAICQYLISLDDTGVNMLTLFMSGTPLQKLILATALANIVVYMMLFHRSAIRWIHALFLVIPLILISIIMIKGSINIEQALANPYRGLDRIDLVTDYASMLMFSGLVLLVYAATWWRFYISINARRPDRILH